MAAQAPRAWQRMLSGRRLDLLDPSPLDIEIEDIAHGLARVARWNGQTVGPYIFSVAQHSLLVEAVAGEIEPGLDARRRLAILLHDAPEYVIGDAYKAVEARLAAAIHLRFGLPAERPAAWTRLLKRADHVAAFHEATRLAGFSREEAQKFFGRPAALSAATDALLTASPIETVEARYLDRFAALTNDGA